MKIRVNTFFLAIIFIFVRLDAYKFTIYRGFLNTLNTFKMASVSLITIEIFHLLILLVMSMGPFIKDVSSKGWVGGSIKRRFT